MNDWTLMVYISADDILANFAIESLKQMKRAAGHGVEVVAQFDANLGGNVPVYAFSDSKKEESSIVSNLITSLQGPVDMTDPAVLTAFINMATEKYPAKHYGLVLWGHGPELLFDDNVPPRTPPLSRRYFTPANLRKALKRTELLKKEEGKSKLDIIAIDACCMAAVEVAGELRDCARYLIASQDDVPDASFPYEQLLDELKLLCKKNDIRAISKMIPEAYQEAFQDYIPTPANGLGTITLTTLDLQKIDTITSALKDLAFALLNASVDPIVRKQILDARSSSHDFDYGLFVDLFDFCDQLERTGQGSDGLTSACASMRDAIDGQKNECIIENRASGEDNMRCHGLSVYLPYQTQDPPAEGMLLGKNGTAHPTKDRTQGIIDLEGDYSELKTPGQAEWMKFIRQGWSAILATEIPDELDTHYSAQQCAQNLLPEANATIKATLSPQTDKTTKSKLPSEVSKAAKSSVRSGRKTRWRPPNGAANGSGMHPDSKHH